MKAKLKNKKINVLIKSYIGDSIIEETINTDELPDFK